MIEKLQEFIKLAEALDKEAVIVSDDEFDPVKTITYPKPWIVLGCGNYAAVFAHPDHMDYVVKIYGRAKEGIKDEIEVYSRLGRHRGYSQCYYYGERFLVLKRIFGTTLFDCVHKGMKIEPTIIDEIDAALDYARQRGLYPHDVHGKNVMISNGHGVIVDVSDFLVKEDCGKWKDLKAAYHKLYRHTLYRFPIKIPYNVLNVVRIGYRWYRKISKIGKKGTKN
ncbi:serine/threonine protein kinase [Fictibacillus iocasae]|uniref:Serine/threonine protein kinase n=1 Tax=Fictibacillus iocasae TaxID=2715437 RepID=A0ABW2NRY7_9BACL